MCDSYRYLTTRFAHCICLQTTHVKALFISASQNRLFATAWISEYLSIGITAASSLSETHFQLGKFGGCRWDVRAGGLRVRAPGRSRGLVDAARGPRHGARLRADTRVLPARTAGARAHPALPPLWHTTVSTAQRLLFLKCLVASVEFKIKNFFFNVRQLFLFIS